VAKERITPGPLVDASPGYPAGPSPLMRPEEQGGPAGTIGMNNGPTFVLAPA